MTLEQQITDLKQALAQFQSSHPARHTVVERFQSLLSAAPRCAFRDNFTPGHLTGSAWIVDHSGSKVLLLHHGKLDRWLQPGGHADGEFDLAQVALREAQEETGLRSVTLATNEIFDLDIHEIPARGEEPSHLHFDVRYLFRADAAEGLVVSHESRALAWVEICRVGRYTCEESVLRMARAL